MTILFVSLPKVHTSVRRTFNTPSTQTFNTPSDELLSLAIFKYIS